MSLRSRARTWYRRRWLRVAYPDWDQIPVDDREQAEGVFSEMWFSRWYPWYLLLVSAGALTITWTMFIIATESALVSPLVAIALLVLAIPAGAVALLAIDLGAMFVGRGALRRAARRGLRRRGVEVCPECGYFLTAAPATLRYCSECGAARRPLEGAAVGETDGPGPS